MSSRTVPTMKSLSTADRRSVNANHTSASRPRVASGEEIDRRSTTTAPHARTKSASMRAPPAGSGERRTEKKEVRERETETRRTRSPLKHSSEGRVNARTRTEKQAREVERPSRSAASQKSEPQEPQPPWEPQASLIPHDRSARYPHLHSSSSLYCSSVAATHTTRTTVPGGPGEGHIGGSIVRVYGL
ncbi:hypothetical protein P3342_009956 [Pyrenophora teres f. teres]|nr:hypothetical protein P3342_009956 [Pyrenophora teres f. teres]